MVLEKAMSISNWGVKASPSVCTICQSQFLILINPPHPQTSLISLSPSNNQPIISSTFNSIKNFTVSKINQRRIMASTVSNSSFEYKTFQLDDEHDFIKIASPDGYISICGFGSLLSEKSALSTFPDLINFRIVKLKGFRRVFAHVAPVFFERGIANPDTKEMSSLSVEPCEGEELIISVFEIRESGVPSFIEREPEFRFLAVFPETLEGKPLMNPAVLCARYSDEELLSVRCKGNKEIFQQKYRPYNIEKIWRDDILPCRLYLRHCVLAVKNLGDLVYNNFLDHTFLSDRQTTIRQYLATTGSGIMEEEPPESLKYRYGG